jgi:hypothetical protein
MDLQVSYFDETIAELRQVMESPARVADLLSSAIYMVVVGANDFLDNYLFPVPLTLDKFLPSPVYIRKVIVRYEAQLTVTKVNSSCLCLLQLCRRNLKVCLSYLCLLGQYTHETRAIEWTLGEIF